VFILDDICVLEIKYDDYDDDDDDNHHTSQTLNLILTTLTLLVSCTQQRAFTIRMSHTSGEIHSRQCRRTVCTTFRRHRCAVPSTHRVSALEQTNNRQRVGTDAESTRKNVMAGLDGRPGRRNWMQPCWARGGRTILAAVSRAT